MGCGQVTQYWFPRLSVTTSSSRCSTFSVCPGFAKSLVVLSIKTGLLEALGVLFSVPFMKYSLRPEQLCCALGSVGAVE